MRFAFLVGLTALAMGCDSPAPLGTLQCGPTGECPPGQTCVNGFCGASPFDSAMPEDAAEPDAPVEIDAALPPDAAMLECAGGDNRCLVSCAPSDPDCMTTCGDGRCVGNAGELCPGCEADCKTRDVVCGNGQCQEGEIPDCYADCGPNPWPWTAQENDLLVRINQKRVAGHACPNMPMTTAPPLTAQMALQPTARDWVWEMAHHEYIHPNGHACNGRTLNDRTMPVEFNYAAWGRGYVDNAAAIEDWFSHNIICPRLMAPGYTQAYPSIALDNLKAFLVLLR